MFFRSVRSLALLFPVVLLAACSEPAPPAVGEQVVEHNILGTAYLGQQKWPEAAGAFESALELRPDDPLLLTNLAVARNQQGEIDTAVALLDRALARNPDYPYAHYNLGLIRNREGQFEPATEHFAAVARFDPDDLFTQYYLGTALSRMGRTDEAVEALRRALQRNPAHVSSLYGLGRLLIQSGDQEEGTRLITLSQQIRARSGLDEAVGGQYGEQGPYAMGIDYPGDVLAAPASVEVRFELAAQVRLEPGPTGEIAWTLAPRSEGAAMLLVAQRGSVLQLLPAGRAEALAPPPPDGAEILALEAGDANNDGHVDLVALLARVERAEDGSAGAPGPVRPALALQGADGSWSWSGDAFSGAVEAPAATGDLAWGDRDHDGDLDLVWCWSGGAAGCRIATNDGTGRFDTRPASEHGVRPALGATGPVFVAFSDVDNDRDVDLLVGAAGGIGLYSNQRDGTFADVSDAVGLGAAVDGVSSMIVADLNKDGWMDLLVACDAGTQLLVNRRGSFDAPTALEGVPPAGDPGARLAVFDMDNDGFFDLARRGATQVEFFRNEGRGRWSAHAATRATGDDARGATPLVAYDADADGDLDLIQERAGTVGLLLNQGGNANGWIRLAAKGIGDNKFGIGAKVEVLAGALRQKFEITRPLPVHAGLGSRRRIQSARYLWPSGVLQDEIELDAGAPVEIVQLDRKGTSCPLLYAWRDGGWHFVTDFLGGCAVGYQLAPGVFSNPDTDEYVRIEGGLDEDADGMLRLRLNNQLEEVIWFDQVELVAVDHPLGTRVYPNERLMPAAPFPPFRLFASDDVRPVRAARAVELDRDLTPTLREADRQFADHFELLGPKGYAQMHTLELDLGSFAPGQRVVLLLDGWIDYADSSANLAAAQAGLKLVPPRLLVADGRDGWKELEGRMGFPAGLPKTMALDLSGVFPTTDHRLRIATNMRIYWDRARVMLGGEATPLQVRRLSPATAELGFGGYPREVSADGRMPFGYDPDDVAPVSNWKAHVGAYTPFGDVRERVLRIDDRFVTTKSGDALELRFESPGPPAPGRTRTFLLYADGFGKDMDPNSAASDEVGPIPFHGMPVYPYPADVSPPAGAADTPGRYVLRAPDGLHGVIPQVLATRTAGADAR